jgi:hypothetical protein
MSETITAINDVTNDDGYMDGFDVVTTAQTIKLRITNDQSCCERAGYLFTNDTPAEFVGAEVRGVVVTDTALHSHDDIGGDGKNFYGGIMFVNIETDRGALQFAAYNEQNGYYGHEASVTCAQLTHSEMV